METKQFPTFEEVSGETWMSGSLKVQQSPQSVVLKKLINIPILVSWCALIMGGVTFFVSHRTESALLTSAFLVTSIVVISVFLVVAYVLNKRPIILSFDKASQTISSPRVEGLTVPSSNVELWLVPAWVHRHHKHDRSLSQIVVLYLLDTNTEVPVFCELSSALESKLRKFANISGLPMRIAENRTIHAYP